MEFSRRFLLSGLTFAVATPALAKDSDFKDLQAAVDRADEGVLHLPAGEFGTAPLRLTKPIRIEGVPGLTKIKVPVTVEGTENVSLCGLNFASPGTQLTGTDASIAVDACTFDGGERGLSLERCAGAVRNSRFVNHAVAAIFALDNKGLEISGNTVLDIGTNAIMVWTSAKVEDATLVSGNRIARVASLPGDTGQTGNGISIFRAGNVVVSGNRISDCAYSAIRNNGGSNCQIIGNSASRLGETALYCEFEFQGAVIANNIIDTAGNGISITNFDVGGRLASCTGNVIRRCKGFGIFAEAQTTVIGNAVEDAIETGIGLGWSFAAKALVAANNVVVGCGRGITFSVAEGAEPPMIVNNRIAASRHQAIAAMNHSELASGDLALDASGLLPGAVISGNIVG